MRRNFEEWLNTFRESIANYSYYIEFNTVYNNLKEYKKGLEKLNCLIGANNIEDKFDELVSDTDVLKCLPILLAKRERSIFCMDDEGIYRFNFDEMNYSKEEYKMFMRKTGLFDLMQHHLINNLYDYVVGVEVGLNSNGRKNRGGHLMEDLVEHYIQQAGFIKNVSYFKEMYLKDLEKLMNLDLSALSNDGKASKRFDFVFIKNGCAYACECNFYASGGSKLNETARSYKTLALESKNIKNFKFVWFTDGVGWHSAKHNLQETFDVLEDIYNITDLENGILKDI